MTGTGEDRSPRQVRWNQAGLVAALLVVALPAGAALVHASPSGDCARAPRQHPPDALGVPLEQVTRFLARQYATDTDRVHIVRTDEDAVEIAVWDASGDFFHGTVRAERVGSGGWLIATTDTCDD